MAAISCFGRIQKYLLTQARHDPRVPTIEGSSRADSVSATENKDELQLKDLPSCDGEIPSRNSAAIVVQDGKFGWAPDGEPTLQDINFEVAHSQLVMVVGTVASGKSTLLHALLGETPVSAGLVQLSSHDIAFCDQTPWITNESLRRNVTGFSNFDASWYSAVLYACALEDDIKQFPEGDSCILGSNGITLSGGQRQRVVSTLSTMLVI